MGKRDESRVQMVLPVRVWGMDRQEKPFNQLAWTLDVSHTGARLVGVGKILKGTGEVIGIQNGAQKARFKVAWIGAEGTPREGQIAVRALEPGINLWGLGPARQRTDRYRGEGADSLAAQEWTSRLEDLGLELTALEQDTSPGDLDLRMAGYFRLASSHLRAVSEALGEWLKLQAQHADPFPALATLNTARIAHATEMMKEVLRDIESGEADFTSEEMRELALVIDALARHLSRSFRI